MEDWLARDQSLKRSSNEKRRALTKDVLPRFGAIPIDKITRGDVRALLDHIVDRGADIHASRVLAYLRRLFNWAAERDIIPTGSAVQIKPPASDRTLTPAELASVWAAATAISEPFGSFLRMLVLTGQRRSEVANARWSEIDLVSAEWTIPAGRALAGQR